MQHQLPIATGVPGDSRRRFLTGLGAAAAGVVLTPWSRLAAAGQDPAPSSSERAVVGSNAYGWTQYAQRDQKPFDVGEVISALRDCGYDYLEGFMNVGQPEENAKFAEQLKAKGLRPVSIYAGAALHEPGKADESVAAVLKAAKVCSESGFKVLSCNPNPIGREKTDEELKTQAAALVKLGEGLNAIGMQLGVHHHLPEMANDAREFHHVFRHTPANRVGFCYDVHWVWKGGIKPEEALRLYGDRVVTWHIRQSREGVWWENLDTGDIDYAAVAAYAKEKRLPRRFTVELALEPGTKITRSAVENHRRSREFIRKVFGA